MIKLCRPAAANVIARLADSWPRTIDDRAAREEWGWAPQYGLAEMVEDMLEKLGRKHAEGKL